ncbi:hypothetical protein BDF20DRAFT_877509 [Mycotypha africana]|uniref:uncharacterized protein n=1 Tax=Mycotypha africana TaxID=64632 RepID=UPI0023005D25|nr:uncharacterized protein BDF20DRAFT_877509 [Mycotypha africana]KAI8975227.1 hypothetical protein BDF20DRAFT_877509 [Mycotypha africana]
MENEIELPLQASYPDNRREVGKKSQNNGRNSRTSQDACVVQVDETVPNTASVRSSPVLPSVISRAMRKTYEEGDESEVDEVYSPFQSHQSQLQQQQQQHHLEVLYHNRLNNSKTIEMSALNAYMQNTSTDDLITSTEEGHDLERQLTAKLDDLLDSSNNNNNASSIERPNYPGSRRFSLYGENVKDPSIVNKSIDRYTFYLTELGSIKSRSLKQLLQTPTGKQQGKTVADLLVQSTSWWIDIFAPSNDEMRTLSKIFKIHPLTTEDIQAQEARDKCEIFQNYMFISFRSFNHDFHSSEYLEAVSFYIVIFKDGVLTFRFQDLPHPHNVRKRIHQLKDFIKVTPEWINYALIDNITDSFAPLIQQTEIEVDSIDDLVLVLNGSEQSDMLRRIGSCRKTVMQLIRLLGPKADVVRSLIKRYEDEKIKEEKKQINGLISQVPSRMNMAQQAQQLNDENTMMEADDSNEKDEEKVHHEVTLYLGDIQDHILTMLQNVNHYDLILGRAHRNYLGQISIELSQAGNTTNEVINRLTFFATIVVPLNLVGGLFGMNVHVPGQDNTDLVWFFWIVLGMLVYVVIMVAAGKRSGFL